MRSLLAHFSCGLLALTCCFAAVDAQAQITTKTNKLMLLGSGNSITLVPPSSGTGNYVFEMPIAPTNAKFVLTESTSGQTIANGVNISDWLNLTTGTELRLNGSMGSNGSVLGVSGGALAWIPGGAGVSLSDNNTWTGIQTYSSTIVGDINGNASTADLADNATLFDGNATTAFVISGDAAGGDLEGTYPNPTLPDIGGLTPDTYTNATVTVDAKGRVTFASNGSGGSGTVVTNATMTGDGSIGTPLSINLANANTWTAAQTFNQTIAGSINGNAATATNATQLGGVAASGYALASHTHAAADITSGTFADGMLSANIARLGSAQIVTGNWTFNNSISGNLSGNASTATAATTATTASALANTDAAGQSAIVAINLASTGNILATRQAAANAAFSGGAPGSTVTSTEASYGTVTITPTSTTAKIMIMARMDFTKDAGNTVRVVTMRVRRGNANSDPAVGQDATITSPGAGGALYGPSVIMAIDQPGTTGAVTYSIRAIGTFANNSTAARYELTAYEIR